MLKQRLLFSTVFFLILKLGWVNGLDPDLEQEELELPVQIARAIINHDIEFADENIPKLSEKSEWKFDAIALVFNYKFENLPFLIDYACKSRKSSIGIWVLSTLWSGFKENILQGDLVKLCEFYKMLSYKVIMSEDVEGDFKAQAEKIMISEIRQRISDSAAVEMIHDNNQQVADAVYFANETLFDEIINKVIKKKYPTFLRLQLLEVWKYHFTAQSAACLLAIIRNSLALKRFKGNEILLLAENFSKLLKKDDFPNLSKYKRSNIKNWIQIFPQSVQSLYFSPKVCIRNQLDKYIHVATPHDEWKHNVFISPKKFIDSGEMEWIPIPYGEFKFKFLSAKYANESEHLYAGHNVEWLSDERRIFTWVSYGFAGELDDKLVWRVQLIGDDIISFVNVYHNEILGTYSVDTKELHSTPHSQLRDRLDHCWNIIAC